MRNFEPTTIRGPTLRGLHPSSPHSSGSPLFLGLGPHPFETPSPVWPTFQSPTMTHTRSNNGLAKIGLAKKGFGPNWPNQDGQNGIGQSRSLPPGLGVRGWGPRLGVKRNWGKGDNWASMWAGGKRENWPNPEEQFHWPRWSEMVRNTGLV